MKLKMNNVLNLKLFFDTIEDKTIPIKTAYKLSKIKKIITQEVEFFDTNLQKIIEEYGQKQEDGNFILTEDKKGVKIQEDRYDECQEKVAELYDLEVNFDDELNFKIDELEKLDLSVKDVSLLEAFIVE